MAFYDDPTSLMGLLSLGSTGAQLGGGLYSALAKAAEERKLNALMKAGPNVGQYYAPMSAAEAAGFGRGVMQNYQGAVPQGGYLDSLMGDAMAKRETDRYQAAQAMAYNDWAQRIAGRQFQAGQQPGMPQNIGNSLAQYLMLRAIQQARQQGQQPGATADTNLYGQALDYSLTSPGGKPGTASAPYAPYTLGGGTSVGGLQDPTLGMDLTGTDGSLAGRGTGGGGWD